MTCRAAALVTIGAIGAWSPAPSCWPGTESIANDGLGDQSVRSGRQAVANAELDVKLCDLKVGDREDLLRLFRQRQEIPDRSEVGVILDADEAILAKLRASLTAGAKSACPSAPKLKSTIGLTMNSHCVLRSPIMGRISNPHGAAENSGIS